MNAVQDFVFAYLKSRGKKAFSALSDTEKLQCRYLDLGLVDSMGIIDMVLELERHFDIHFSAEELQSMEFRTVGGLIQLIERSRSHGS